MDIIVMDTNFTVIDIIDSFNSLIWNERYYEAGDFELYMLASKEMFKRLQLDYYLRIAESDTVMIIEKIVTDTDAENGIDYMTVSGRSLESILDRRIIWGQLQIKGNIQNGIQTMLNDAFIAPKDANRKVDNFIFEPSTDTRVTSLTADEQYVGENVYDVVVSLCKKNKIGFRVLLNMQNQMVFNLYSGDDRGYDQLVFPYVVFSSEFENLLTSDHTQDRTLHKNAIWVTGEGNYPSWQNVSVFTNDVASSGLNRRETHLEANDVSSKDSNGNAISSAIYQSQLKERGKTELDDLKEEDTFDGQINDNGVFVYGRDYFIGDIVDFFDAYGHSSRVRVVEYVVGEDENGISKYPTFKSLKDEEDEIK